jgi:Kinesin-associated protein (KAP)
MEASSGKANLSDNEKKLIAIIQKQDRMLYLCFYLLLNLAEDVSVERKMKKKNIVTLLMHMLERSNVELLILAVTFLKKLSIYKENKDQMAKAGPLQLVVKGRSVHSQALSNSAGSQTDVVLAEYRISQLHLVHIPTCLQRLSLTH